MINLKEVLSSLPVSCTDEMCAQFEAYMEGILFWNQKLNLTAITDKDEFIIKHFPFSVAGLMNLFALKK